MPQKSTEKKSNVGVLDRDDRKVEKPKKYKVVMYNDDFTPMDFVVAALMLVFHKSEEEAMKLMFDVHNKNRGIAGVYSKEIADTKVTSVIKFARQSGHPFYVEAEPE